MPPESTPTPACPSCCCARDEDYRGIDTDLPPCTHPFHDDAPALDQPLSSEGERWWTNDSLIARAEAAEQERDKARVALNKLASTWEKRRDFYRGVQDDEPSATPRYLEAKYRANECETCARSLRSILSDVDEGKA